MDWFAFREGRYEPLPHTPDGMYKSEVFPGLWLDAAALLAGDLPRVLRAVDLGATTAEHVAFLQRLRGT